tara:strand:+ start:7032 stop:8900 length:1869 start_codon:yes stop_codon:yes gene_type:complete
MLLGSLAMCVLTTSATAQGGDTCASPDLISGTGLFPWNNTGANTSNFDGGGAPCFTFPGTNPPANGPVTFDRFFEWTATASGDFIFDTEGSAVLDTKMSIHAGTGCSATCLISHDDAVPDDNSPFRYSRVLIQGLVAGNQLVVQVGSWNATIAPDAGVLNVIAAPPPPTNDSCASPIVISGLGVTLYDNTSATASGFDGGGAPCFGASTNPPIDDQMTRDLFYQWTAAAAGDYVFDTRGSANLLDSKLNVHVGTGCAATCVAANDNVFPFQNPPTFPTELTSKVRIPGVNAGDTYLVQLGSWADNQSFGPGVLNVSIDPCATLGDDMFEPNNTCATAAVIASDIVMPYGSLQLHRGDPDYYTVSVPDGNTMNVTINHFVSEIDLQAAAWLSVFCSDIPDDLTSNVSAETSIFGDDAFLVYTNNTGAPRQLILRVDHWNPSIASDCANYGMTITGLSGPPPPPIITSCDPAADHYLGDFVKLETSSFGSGVGSGLHIEAIDGPADEFGFLLASPDGSASLAIFQGVFCLGAPQGRYNPNAATNQGNPSLNSLGQFDGAGILQNIVGTSTTGSGFDVPVALPFSPAGMMIGPGDTYFFQCWYRDKDAGGAASANFSNVIGVTFP